MTMKKVLEEMITTSSDRQAVKYISIYANKYPSKDGFRIDSFISPNFVRITIYEVYEQ